MKRNRWGRLVTVSVAAAALAGLALYATAQQPRQGRQGGFPGMGGMAFGTVQQVQGSTVTVQMQNGETRQVTIDTQTRLMRRDRASLQDVKQGAKVMVRGSFDEQGVWFLPTEVTLGDGALAAGAGPMGMMGRGGMTGVGEVVRVQGDMAQIVLNVSLKGQPSIYNVRQIQANEIKPGETLFAMGQPGDGGVQAMMAVVGEIEMPFGGGQRPPGGPGR